MKRRLSRVGLVLAMYVVGGAIVNVAVAWTCAAWNDPTTSPPYKSSGMVWSDRSLHEQTKMWRGFGVERVERIYGIAYHVGDPETLERYDPSAPRIEVAAGWPRYSMECAAHGTGMPDLRTGVGFEQSIVVERVARGITLADRSGRTSSVSPWRGMPLGPIWPGFAINTVFYAAVLWALFAAPASICRWRRISRGLCPACAYPVGESEVCTECGMVVQPRRGVGM